VLPDIIDLLKRFSWIIVDFSSDDASIKIISSGSTEQTIEIDVSSKCFDLIAKKEEITLIIKYMENIDNFTKEKSEELANIAHIFNSVPIMIGEKNRNGALNDDILYNRYSINAINFTTFSNILENKEYPRVYSKRGGYFVQLKQKEFKDLRQSRNLSLNDLAKQLNVTPKAIYEYESSSMKTRLAHFEEMAKIFKFHPQEFLKEFSETIDIFVKLYKSNYNVIKDLSGFQEEIDQRLIDLGFITYWFNKSPIDMSFEEESRETADKSQELTVSKSRTVFISEISSVKEASVVDLKKAIQRTEKKLENHVEFLKQFSQVLDKGYDMVVLLDNNLFQDSSHVHGVPIVHESEIPSDATKLKKIISERKVT